MRMSTIHLGQSVCLRKLAVSTIEVGRYVSDRPELLNGPEPRSLLPGSTRREGERPANVDVIAANSVDEEAIEIVHRRLESPVPLDKPWGDE